MIWFQHVGNWSKRIQPDTLKLPAVFTTGAAVVAPPPDAGPANCSAETAGPVDARTGLAHAALLPVIFAAAFERARERELPMCIGVLALPQAQLPPALKQAEAMETALRQVAEALSAVGDVARPAVRVGHAAVAFHVADGGPRHAAALCSILLERLTKGGPPALAWRCISADAVACGSVEACVRILRDELQG